jgi:uncharacterized protein (DUF1501 family)
MPRGDFELDRRQVLRGGALGLGGSFLVGASPAAAVRLFATRARGGAELANTLVLVQLAGGNDGLSTVVPYGDEAYAVLRPTLAHGAGDVLKLDEYRGLHPKLAGLRKAWDAARLAIVEGVGYPNPNRSHFESFEIWHAADPRGRDAGEGWIGRLCEASFGEQAEPNRVVHVGASLPYSLHSTAHPAVCFSLPDAYKWVGDDRELAACCEEAAAERAKAPGSVRRERIEFLRGVQRDAQASSLAVRRAADRYRPKASYPNEAFAAALKTCAAMIQERAGSRVLSVELGGFDTHDDQKNRHAQQMERLDAGLSAFLEDLDGTEAAAKTLVLAFSEFGRRVAENGSRGTDHGTAGPVFLLGDAVRGGLYGRHPALDELDDGDLVHTTDFRSVYATVIEKGFGIAHERVLGARFAMLPVLPT